jgi:hypothetical protein
MRRGSDLLVSNNGANQFGYMATNQVPGLPGFFSGWTLYGK